MAKYKYKVVDNVGGSCVITPNSKFYLEYEKDTHVKALEGTLGVMLFKNKKLAIAFLDMPKKQLIKRVIPVGKATVPIKVSRMAGSDVDMQEFNEAIANGKYPKRLCCDPPKGTVCYPEVIVVD